MGRRAAPIALTVAGLALAALPHAASAACTPVERHVTTTADVVDPSDGVLSLREAIADANADPNAIDCERVLLPAGHYTLTSTLTITTGDTDTLPCSDTRPRRLVLASCRLRTTVRGYPRHRREKDVSPTRRDDHGRAGQGI